MKAPKPRPKLAQMAIDVFDSLQSLENQQVQITQSVSRSRNSGDHDRHFAATLQFSFMVKDVGWQISGGHLYLNGENTWLGILLMNIRDFEVKDSDTFIVTEHFEEETERQTIIKIVE